ncbi:MAG TPA: hypothetical protein DCM38_10885 [Gammaproteobacteria bacterium]|nr:hypothetical protein [Gammaproteobacteria bacterium]
MVTNDNRSIALFGNDWCFNAKSFPLYHQLSVISYPLSVISYPLLIKFWGNPYKPLIKYSSLGNWEFMCGYLPKDSQKIQILEPCRRFRF